MVAVWVTPAFKAILIDHCQAWKDSSDMGKVKGRTALVDTIAGLIKESAGETRDPIPDDLNLVCAFLHL